MTTSETLDVIARRYACRAYHDTTVPADLLHAVAEAGVRAPSAVNRQPWKFIVISDKAALDEIGAAGLARLKTADEAGYARIQSRGGILLYNAPAMILVVTEPQPGAYPVELDAGIAVSHMALAATSLGLDTCIVAMPGAAFEDEALKAKYIPEGFDFTIALLLGYAAQPGGTPHQPDFSKITYV